MSGVRLLDHIDRDHPDGVDTETREILSRGSRRSSIDRQTRLHAGTFIPPANTALADDPHRITSRATDELFGKAAAESADPGLCGMTDDDRVAVLVSRE